MLKDFDPTVLCCQETYLKPNTVFHEYLAGIIFSEFVILEISRVFNLAIPKNRAG